MNEINKTLLEFLEKGCFNNEEFKSKESYVESVEKSIYHYGMNRYIDELTAEIKSLLLKTGKFSFFDFDLKIKISDVGIYLYEEPYFQIYSFNSLETEKRVLEIKENNNKILKNAFSIMVKELEVLEHNKNLFKSELEKLIKKEKENGEFHVEEQEDFCSLRSQTPFVSAQFHPKGSYFNVSFLERRFPIKSNDSRIIQNKLYKPEEAQEMLEKTIKEFKIIFQKGKSENIIYNIRTLLRKKYGFHSEDFKKIIFVAANGGKIQFNFNGISNYLIKIPLDVKRSEIDKVYEFLKIINLIENQSEEVQNVLKFFTFNKSEFNLEKGLLVEDSLDFFENFVIEINSKIEYAKKILESKVYPENFESFQYGKSLFFKKNDSFEVSGNVFERIDYRMPLSKKIHSIMYENGSVISANRFFRNLRKIKAKKRGN